MAGRSLASWHSDAGLALAHLAFWAAVDATGTNDEAPQALAVIVGLELSIAVLVGLLALRAGKQRVAALAWGLASATPAAAIYLVFAVIVLTTCNECWR